MPREVLSAEQRVGVERGIDRGLAVTDRQEQIGRRGQNHGLPAMSA